MATLHCPGCKGLMHEEAIADTLVDRCHACEGLWFDATELDRTMPAPAAAVHPQLEAKLPERSRATRDCPRCAVPLHTAGWDSLVFDRCTICRGIFLDRRDWQQLHRGDVPDLAFPFETQIKDLMITAGWTLLHAKGVLYIIFRLMRS